MPRFFLPKIDKNIFIYNELKDVSVKGKIAGLKAQGYTFPCHSYEGAIFCFTSLGGDDSLNRCFSEHCRSHDFGPPEVPGDQEMRPTATWRD